MDPILALLVGIVVLAIGGYIWYKVDQTKREREYQTKLQELPESDRQALITQRQNKNNWGCLTAFLVLAIIGNSLLAIITFAAASSQDGSFSVFGGFLNILCAVFAATVLWKHKKWAVYGYVAVVAFIILINLSIGGLGAAIPGIVPLLLLSAAVRPVWGQLD